jgi:hypothetical protein
VADSEALFPISTANVDIFVDKGHLTAQTARIYGLFNKLPIQKADFIPLKINHLAQEAKGPQNIFAHFLITNFCA